MTPPFTRVPAPTLKACAGLRRGAEGPGRSLATLVQHGPHAAERAPRSSSCGARLRAHSSQLCPSGMLGPKERRGARRRAPPARRLFAQSWPFARTNSACVRTAWGASQRLSGTLWRLLSGRLRPHAGCARSRHRAAPTLGAACCGTGTRGGGGLSRSTAPGCALWSALVMRAATGDLCVPRSLRACSRPFGRTVELATATRRRPAIGRAPCNAAPPSFPLFSLPRARAARSSLTAACTRGFADGWHASAASRRLVVHPACLFVNPSSTDAGGGPQPPARLLSERRCGIGLAGATLCARGWHQGVALHSGGWRAAAPGSLEGASFFTMRRALAGILLHHHSFAFTAWSAAGLLASLLIPQL